MRTNRKVYATDADVDKIDWRDAERLLGVRVDRRRAFWKCGKEVFYNGLDRIEDLDTHWRVFPYP